MDKYISREAIRNTLYEADAITMKGVAILNQFPAADVVEVRHAYKINIATVEDYVPWCKCSACGYDGLFLEDEYCSCCGTKLDGGQDDD